MTTRNVQLKVMGNLALDVKHGYRTSMSKTSHANTTVAVVCNPTSNKGKGAQVGGHVIDLLRGAGRKHGFDVIDVTGTSFDDSLANARRRGDEYDYLVAVGGDGMVALGANAVGCSGKPLGIVAIGSGGVYAQSAAKALLENTELSAEEIVRKSLAIAGELCIYTNMHHTIETL